MFSMDSRVPIKSLKASFMRKSTTPSVCWRVEQMRAECCHSAMKGGSGTGAGGARVSKPSTKSSSVSPHMCAKSIVLPTSSQLRDRSAIRSQCFSRATLPSRESIEETIMRGQLVPYQTSGWLSYSLECSVIDRDGPSAEYWNKSVERTGAGSWPCSSFTRNSSFFTRSARTAGPSRAMSRAGLARPRLLTAGAQRSARRAQREHLPPPRH
mmetsp:Transcript_4359/g.9516  ORF Transcript_4359/g.9516 Transcript_4359/m.9516 type:complete len:211 (-) Transcript_4359:183-815(-)